MVEYLHPAYMVLTLTCVMYAFRLGLEIRRLRLAGGRRPRELRARHLRFGKLAVMLVLPGFIIGLATTTFWLSDVPLSTFHGLLASLALLAFGGTGYFGGRLEKGDASVREMHALAAMAGVLMAATAAVAGFVLLP